MNNPKAAQYEIDSLRQEVKRLQEEVTALRSGKEESRSIAESAEVLAAERDAAKALLAEATAHAADLLTVIRSWEANMAPPPDVLKRVNTKRFGTKLQDGVLPKAVPA